MQKDAEVDPLVPIKNAPPEIKEIIRRVLELERDKLYQKRPHLNADILQIVKEEIA